MSEGKTSASRRLYGGEPMHARRRDQRDRLLQAAREVFAGKGYAGASIDEVVARAHVSRTSFYRFFANKEECILAVFTGAMSGLAEAFAEAAGAEEPGQRIRVGVRGIISRLAADPEAARVVLVEAVGVSAGVERARLEAWVRFAEPLAAELRRSPGWRDRPAVEVELTALATLAAVVGSVGVLVTGERAANREEIVEPLTSFAMRALTPEVERQTGASEVAARGGGIGIDELGDQR